jgi:hypothetical protein
MTRDASPGLSPDRPLRWLRAPHMALDPIRLSQNASCPSHRYPGCIMLSSSGGPWSRLHCRSIKRRGAARPAPMAPSSSAHPCHLRWLETGRAVTRRCGKVRHVTCVTTKLEQAGMGRRKNDAYPGSGTVIDPRRNPEWFGHKPAKPPRPNPFTSAGEKTKERAQELDERRSHFGCYMGCSCWDTDVDAFCR